jgi:broad specificity phosphatase PhoE
MILCGSKTHTAATDVDKSALDACVVPSGGVLLNRSFWFLRHGETDWNKQILAQGQVEIPLNQTGLEQARQAAQTLRGRGIERIYTSPLSRAQRTAQIVAEALGVPVAIEPELIEAAFGEQEGQPMAEWFQGWVDERATPVRGESFADLRQRVVRAVNRCVSADDAPVLLVAHGGFMRALRAEMGLERNVRTPNAAPLQCCPPEQDGVWTLLSPPA